MKEKNLKTRLEDIYFGKQFKKYLGYFYYLLLSKIY